jgi:hypothetical protein
MIKPMGNRITDQDRATLKQLYKTNGAICLLVIISEFLLIEPDTDSARLSSAIETLTNQHAHEEDSPGTELL